MLILWLFIITAKLTTPLEDFVFTSSLTSPKPARTITVRDYFLGLVAHFKQPACPLRGNKYTLIKQPFILLPVTISLIEDVLCWFPEVCVCWRNCHFACQKKGHFYTSRGAQMHLLTKQMHIRAARYSEEKTSYCNFLRDNAMAIWSPLVGMICFESQLSFSYLSAQKPKANWNTTNTHVTMFTRQQSIN